MESGTARSVVRRRVARREALGTVVVDGVLVVVVRLGRHTGLAMVRDGLVRVVFAFEFGVDQLAWRDGVHTWFVSASDRVKRHDGRCTMADALDTDWDDPRARDDRTAFFECEHCGDAVRWITLLDSERGRNLQVTARPVARGRWFDPRVHLGLVAVLPDRTGFTVGRFELREDLEDTVLYRCHWDTCDGARAMRDRIAGQRSRLATEGDGAFDHEDEVVLRYEQWRRGV